MLWYRITDVKSIHKVRGEVPERQAAEADRRAGGTLWWVSDGTTPGEARNLRRGFNARQAVKIKSESCRLRKQGAASTIRRNLKSTILTIGVSQKQLSQKLESQPISFNQDICTVLCQRLYRDPYALISEFRTHGVSTLCHI